MSEAGSPTSDANPVTGGWLLCDASVDPVLDFISEFKNHIGSLLTDSGPIRRYIEDRRDGELLKWDILFASINRIEEDTIIDNSLGLTINCQRRTAGQKSDAGTLRVTNKQRVASRGVEKTGLSKPEIEDAEKKYRESIGRDGDDQKRLNYPDRIYRAKRKLPLLIIHLLRITPESGGQTQSEPVVAWSISFPQTNTPENRVEYIVNTTWLRENFLDEIDEEEMGGDNE